MLIQNKKKRFGVINIPSKNN